MSLHQIRSDWTALGTDDPLWAVLATPDRRHGRWDAGAFLATGRDEVAAVFDHLRDLGLTPGEERALDFGCGAGRLTIALADHVAEPVGVDIAEPMLAKARELDATGRCRFVRNDSTNLAQFDGASFDVVMSSLVLQHLPPPLARGYLRELVRVLRPGGALVVQLATRPDRSLRGLLVRLLPLRAVRFLQKRILRYPAPMDMHPMTRAEFESTVTSGGGRLIDAVDEPMYGGNWRYTRYYAIRT
ncbi:MAG TPA: class I SAM-dependent methyltransferase [Jatrophihabitans sp.]|jgi:SAM-dependent methyltransferase